MEVCNNIINKIVDSVVNNNQTVWFLNKFVFTIPKNFFFLSFSDLFEARSPPKLDSGNSHDHVYQTKQQQQVSSLPSFQVHLRTFER